MYRGGAILSSAAQHNLNLYLMELNGNGDHQGFGSPALLILLANSENPHMYIR
jgi:hypothetical protein